MLCIVIGGCVSVWGMPDGSVAGLLVEVGMAAMAAGAGDDIFVYALSVLGDGRVSVAAVRRVAHGVQAAAAVAAAAEQKHGRQRCDYGYGQHYGQNQQHELYPAERGDEILQIAVYRAVGARVLYVGGLDPHIGAGTGAGTDVGAAVCCGPYLCCRSGTEVSGRDVARYAYKQSGGNIGRIGMVCVYTVCALDRCVCDALLQMCKNEKVVPCRSVDGQGRHQCHADNECRHQYVEQVLFHQALQARNVSVAAVGGIGKRHAEVGAADVRALPEGR